MRHELLDLCGGAHALATQILGNPDDAADAVQDALATALGKPGAYDATRGPLKPWFLRVVRNRCVDQIRRRRQHVAMVDEPALVPEVHPAACDHRNRGTPRAFMTRDDECAFLHVLFRVCLGERHGPIGVA